MHFSLIFSPLGPLHRRHPGEAARTGSTCQSVQDIFTVLYAEEGVSACGRRLGGAVVLWWLCLIHVKINYWSYLKRTLFEGQRPLVSDTSIPFSSFTWPPTGRFFNGCVASRFRCDRSRTDRNTLCTLAGAQGQCGDLKCDLPEGEKKKRKRRKSQRCACVCSNPTDQSSNGGLTPPTNHVRVPLQVITCTFKETKRGRNISRPIWFSVSLPLKARPDCFSCSGVRCASSRWDTEVLRGGTV